MLVKGVWILQGTVSLKCLKTEFIFACSNCAFGFSKIDLVLVLTGILLELRLRSSVWKQHPKKKATQNLKTLAQERGERKFGSLLFSQPGLLTMDYSAGQHFVLFSAG